MRKKKAMHFAFFLFSFLPLISFSQQGVVSAGGEATGTGGSAAFSVGQVDYMNYSGSGGKITEGIQQPFEILIITNIEDKRNDIGLNVFPNPVAESLNLQISDPSEGKFSFELYDDLGKLIKKEQVASSTNLISMQGLAGATYFVKVLKSDREIKTFKIIKKS